jgi:hypothetical protein
MSDSGAKQGRGRQTKSYNNAYSRQHEQRYWKPKIVWANDAVSVHEQPGIVTMAAYSEYSSSLLRTLASMPILRCTSQHAQA